MLYLHGVGEISTSLDGWTYKVNDLRLEDCDHAPKFWRGPGPSMSPHSDATDMSHLAGITVKLQRKTLDIMQAHQMVSEVTDTYRDERQVVHRGFDSIYQASVRLAEKVGTAITMSRITDRQQHRSNPECTSPKDYFRKTVAISLLDHIIASMHGVTVLCCIYCRIHALSKSVRRGIAAGGAASPHVLDMRGTAPLSCAACTVNRPLGLVPSLLCSREVDLDRALTSYRDDMPKPKLFSAAVEKTVHRHASR